MIRETNLNSFLLLYMIRKEGPIGRYRLCKMLDLPEGVTRGFLARFLKKGLISARKKGCELTLKGGKSLQSFLAKYRIADIKEFDAGPLAIANSHVAVHIKGVPPIPSVIELRDIAVRAGSRGAIFLTLSKGILNVPKVYQNLALKFPELAERIFATFKLEEDDAIIISGAEDGWKALKGALAVAISLRH